MKSLVVSTVIAVQQVPIDKLNECFKRELDSCGDKICEMSTDDNSEIIKQLWKNVLDCIKKNK
jgi:hypothetical protein